ncbi:MAG: SBBP repeat-containing protein, partial [Candidatus Firestonebacteria bacterium]
MFIRDKILLFSVCIFLFAGQSLIVEGQLVQSWTQIYDGVAKGLDCGEKIAVDKSGNVYVVGCEEVSGQGTNIWIRKYGTGGNEIWTQTYNNNSENYYGSYGDKGHGIAVDDSGNVYITGAKGILPYEGVETELFVRKYDTNGTALWTKTYSGTASGYPITSGKNIAVDNAGYVYVVGLTEKITIGPSHDDFTSNIIVIKYDAANGDEKWVDTTYVGMIADAFEPYPTCDIAVSKNGNIYVVGSINNSSNVDVWIRKYDKDKNIAWTKNYNGAGSSAQYDSGRGIAVDDSENIYITGFEWTNYFFALEDIFVIKFDTSGVLKWKKSYRGMAEEPDYSGIDMGNDIMIDKSGNILVVGIESVMERAHNNYLWIRKYDSNGNVILTYSEFIGYKKAMIGSDTTADMLNLWNGIAVDDSGYIYIVGSIGQTWDEKYKADILVRKYYEGEAPNSNNNNEGSSYFKIISNKDGYVRPTNGEVAKFVYKTSDVGTVNFKVYNLRGDLIR